MADNRYDQICEKLKEPVKIYLNRETKLLLIEDCKSFEIDNRNLFYNKLIENYINEYTEKLETSGRRILAMMEELVSARNKDEFPVIARKIAYRAMSSDDKKEREDYISIRIKELNVDMIAAMIDSATDEVKISVFFRNLFLDYLSLPAYRREQIIFADQYSKIMQAIKERRKLSYRNKKSKKSHTISPYSLEQSSTEFHNYLVGSYDNGKGAASIKLLSIDKAHLLNEKAEFNDTFEECYKAMEDNGCQFGIKELQYWKIYLNEEDMNSYNGHYLDRPKIHSTGTDENGNWYIFNCSKFQLDSYFDPFKRHVESENININE